VKVRSVLEQNRSATERVDHSHSEVAKVPLIAGGQRGATGLGKTYDQGNAQGCLKV